MAKLYRKTEKGQAEIATRAAKLPPRFRAALIMVDGRRTDDELARMIPAEPDTTLRWLTESGFIELASDSANSTLFGTSAAPGTDARQAFVDTNPAPARAPAPRGSGHEGLEGTRKTLDVIKRESVRELTGLIGPMADTIAIRIERARSREEIKPLLEIACQMLFNTRGTAAAEAFQARYLDDLMI